LRARYAGRVIAPTTAPGVFVATGAFDCGKTTTLEWLRDHHGVRIHPEAHLRALARLGQRTAGHPPGQPFSAISDPEHFCPMCRPWEFAQLVLDEQRDIELAAQPGDLLERGFLDPIEMLLRRTGAPEHPSWRPIARYVRVLSFDVMPQLQAPRWGKSAEQRTRDAIAINERLDHMYRAAGFEVVHIEAGSVDARAAQVLAYMIC
jgi:predicted ATPase